MLVKVEGEQREESSSSSVVVVLVESSKQREKERLLHVPCIFIPAPCVAAALCERLLAMRRRCSCSFSSASRFIIATALSDRSLAFSSSMC